MGCTECEKLKKRIVDLEMAITGNGRIATIPLHRGSSRIYTYAGCTIRFVPERGSWIGFFDDKEIASGRSLHITQAAVRDWRVKQGLKETTPGRWAGDTKVYTYCGCEIQKIDNVWYIDGKPTDHKTQKEVRYFIKGEKLGHVPIELQKKKSPKQLTGISVLRESWEGVDYWVVRVYGGVYSTGSKKGHRKFFNIKKYGDGGAKKRAEAYRDKIAAEFGVKKTAQELKEAR